MLIQTQLWTLYTKLPTPQSKDAESSTKLRNEVVRLHREMSATSAQDDFAKWARLRREHDKAKDKYDKQCTLNPFSLPKLVRSHHYPRTAQGLQNFRTQFDRVLNALRFIGTQGLNFLANTWFSKQPMFWLPQGWVPYQAEWILSFPRAPLGSVSINIWGIACAGVIGMVIEAGKAGWTLRQGKVVEGPNKGEKIRMEKPLGGAGGGREKKEL